MFWILTGCSGFQDFSGFEVVPGFYEAVDVEKKVEQVQVREGKQSTGRSRVPLYRDV